MRIIRPFIIMSRQGRRTYLLSYDKGQVYSSLRFSLSWHIMSGKSPWSGTFAVGKSKNPNEQAAVKSHAQNLAIRRCFIRRKFMRPSLFCKMVGNPAIGIIPFMPVHYVIKRAFLGPLHIFFCRHSAPDFWARRENKRKELRL